MDLKEPVVVNYGCRIEVGEENLRAILDLDRHKLCETAHEKNLAELIESETDARYVDYDGMFECRAINYSLTAEEFSPRQHLKIQRIIESYIKEASDLAAKKGRRK